MKALKNKRNIKQVIICFCVLLSCGSVFSQSEIIGENCLLETFKEYSVPIEAVYYKMGER